MYIAITWGLYWQSLIYSTVASEVRAPTWKAPTSNHSCHNARKEKQYLTLKMNVVLGWRHLILLSFSLDILTHYVACIKRKLMASWHDTFLAPVAMNKTLHPISNIIKDYQTNKKYNVPNKYIQTCYMMELLIHKQTSHKSVPQNARTENKKRFYDFLLWEMLCFHVTTRGCNIRWNDHASHFSLIKLSPDIE